MGKTLFNRLKLGLAGSLFALGLNGCENKKETNSSTKSYTPYTLNEHTKEDNLEETLKENESLFIFDAKKIVGKECKFSISTQEYFKYKQMNHRSDLSNDYTAWVTYNDTTIKNIATKLTRKLKSPEAKARRLLKFSQNFIYDTRIEENKNYIRYPLETIVENNGDCEDLAILGAALMKSIGIDVILVNHPAEKGENGGHMVLAINGDFQGTYYEYGSKKYFYADAVNSLWNIGDISKKYAGKEAEIYFIK